MIGFLAIVVVMATIFGTIMTMGFRALDYRSNRQIFTTSSPWRYDDFWRNPAIYDLPGYLGTKWSFGLRVVIVYACCWIIKGVFG